MRRVKALGALLGTVLVCTSAATAARPGTVAVDTTFSSGLCSSADVMQTLKGTVRIITANKHKEIQVFPGFRVSFSANGKTLSTAAPAVTHVTYNADGSIDQSILTGPLGALTVPGYGVILLDTGYIVFDGEFAASPVILDRGPHEFFGPEADFEAFCDYFES